MSQSDSDCLKLLKYHFLKRQIAAFCISLFQTIIWLNLIPLLLCFVFNSIDFANA